MITRRTKMQLMVFLLITVVGVSYVGARYARLDRLIIDDTYTVVAHYAESGGIYEGANVSYRGVKIGEVGDMRLTEEGVDVHLEIDDEFDQIPADALAVVGNRSAVGEQFVDLQPQSDAEPFLAGGAEIEQASTATPIAVEKLLGDAAATVSSVNRDALRTTVTELGTAFDGAGADLQKILDTTSSFIQAANDNFDVTTALIRDANTVLRGQVDSESALRTFATEMSQFSGTLADSDEDLRSLITNGSTGAAELRDFLSANEVELNELLGNLVTTGEIVEANLPGFRQVLVVYPYVVEGGFTVLNKNASTGEYRAHFGLIITTDAHMCHEGYEGTNRRPPQQTQTQPMNTDARCTEPPTASNPRGVQNYRAPVAAYDPDTGELTWADESAAGGLDLGAAQAPAPGSVAPRTLGKDSWKWLFLQPLSAAQE